MAEITLGEDDQGPVAFDPVEPTDFRIAYEGASKTGKSNSLAVLYEDAIADSPIPTLIVERLGILSTLRNVDDSLVVVGAREEPGIDLAVPLDAVEMVAEMVLDQGLRVLLDASTYAGLGDSDEHTEHLAVARVLRALDSNAQARLRTGDRRKCLVVVDEVHYFAPESGAPHIETDDAVKRARAQLVTISTEGGNKGINLVAAYQRRAYVSKGVISQMDNYVIHRLHKRDRKDAAAEVGCDEDLIADLGTGEVLVYGDITNQRLRGPLTVRRRTSPDPREESFEVPERTGDLQDILDDLAEDVDEARRERAARRDRIEELEDEVDRLEAKNEELRERADVEERMAEAFDRIASGEGEAVEVAEDVEELVDQRDEALDEADRLGDEVEALRDEIAEKDETIARLEADVADLRELEAARDEAVANARSTLRAFGEYDAEVDERVEDLQDRVDELRAERDRLQDEAERARSEADAASVPRVEPLHQYEDFLEDEDVRGAFNEAKDESDVADAWFDATIATILDEGGAVTYEDIAETRGWTQTNKASAAASRLAEYGILTKERNDEGVFAVDFNVEGINDIREKAERRRRRQELMEDFA